MRSSTVKQFIALVAICLSLPLCLVGCTDNEFTSNIYTQDYYFMYDDSDGSNVNTIIIPKYDFIDFSYQITYYGSGLLNDYQQEIKVGKIRAGTELTHSESIANIENNIRGSYSYTDIYIISGKKQKKYDTAIKLNNELDFVFTMKYSGDYILNCQVTNNTNNYIKEIRTLRISLDFGDDIRCKFYTPRLILNSPLAPYSTITLNNLSGNKHIGLGSSNTEQKKELLRGGLKSISYNDQTYQLIYDSSMS